MAEEKKHKHEEVEEKKEKIVETSENKKDKKQKEIQKPKKTEAVVNGLSLHMSTKTAAGISRFIKGKKIQRAIEELEEVTRIKRAIPMKAGYAHRKGEMMSGKYPQKAAGNFIILLKSLQANANFLGVENPIISESVSNIAPRPFGKFGSVRRKRTHVKLIARSAVTKENMKVSKKNKKQKGQTK
ncbi:MAG: uL22 family ribosomal protein [Nanoarchaeota archaeon]